MSGGALHCAPGRTIQHTAPRAAVPKYRVVYASASRSAMHTPVDVTGIEPAKGLCLQGLGLSTFDTHPTILFWLGNLTQWWADGRPVAGLSASVSRGARPEPPKQRKEITCSLSSRFLQAPHVRH